MQKYGGAFVSNKTLAQVFRILSKGDANVGQIPQNQISLLNLIEIMGTEQQKQFIFSEILAGKRLANGGPERNTHDSKTLKPRLLLKTANIFKRRKVLFDGNKFCALARN